MHLLSPGASATLKAETAGQAFRITGIGEALALPRTQVRVFGKPEIRPGRRMAVALSAAEDVEIARTAAKQAASMLKVEVIEDEQ
ncbi:Phosphoribosylglycinamide formyltransferase 2 [compost metagenome]